MLLVYLFFWATLVLLTLAVVCFLGRLLDYLVVIVSYTDRQTRARARVHTHTCARTRTNTHTVGALSRHELPQNSLLVFLSTKRRAQNS